MTIRIIARVSLKAILDNMNATNGTDIDGKPARVILRKHRIAKHGDNYAFLDSEIARIKHLIDPVNHKSPDAPVKVKRVRKAKAPVEA